MCWCFIHYKSTKFIHVLKFCADLKSYLELNFLILGYIQERWKALSLQTKDVIMWSILRVFTHTSGCNIGIMITKTKLKTIIHH